MSLRILLVEDEPNLGNTLQGYLQQKSWDCLWAQSAEEARKLFVKEPHVILMDIGLPDGNGLELAKEFQAQNKNFVLLFLSALNDPDIKVESLEMGAADYITKPFALKELTLRLERIIESQELIDKLPEEIQHGSLKIFFANYQVQDGTGKKISLSLKECAILQLLYEKRNQAVDRDEIITKIWGQTSFPSNRTVDNYIVKLRKWCDSDPEALLSIESIRGVGYRLTIKESSI